MKTKKYTANTMVDALQKVRSDLGEDAIILSSNLVQSKGVFGLFRKKSVEVVAGYEQLSTDKSKHRVSEPDHQKPVHAAVSTDVDKEISDIKKMLQQLQQTSEYAQLPSELKPMLMHLENQGLHHHFVVELGNDLQKILKAAKKDISGSALPRIVQEKLLTEIADLPFGGLSMKKKYINVVGPTGVGKTTTIAKIAARAVLEKKKKVGFITTDTYRIAAIEQLRTYANLLQAPVEVVYNREDLQRAIEKLADRDLVFIDTAGRNYKEEKYVEDLSSLLDFSLDMESYLVLSMTSKEEDMRKVVDQFRVIPIEKFIFTKIDETETIGAMFHLMRDYRIGAAYFTDGQEVPEDLMEATPDLVLSRFVKDSPYV
ncbi:flagellar biosynthesis protein FlhF [Sporosarcina sp. HYO08]|uniref:flagellar biosynthesis protein FlhF n=1 Tax=Sporosarcina sp. HYO08 TaxID=1759557 RepID=UPI00079509A3|nr:flagellar biosynthesis protein FlhF [Sporosarcina sp. HYO08]KXH79998.1 flagellar biosynthesis protein FlhF [Sporosarcina sp. HYO08]